MINFVSPPHCIISPCISVEHIFNGAHHWRCSLVDLNYAVAAVRFRILCDDIYKHKVPSFAKSCLFLFLINWNTREKTSYFFQVYYENRSFRHVALLGLLCHFVWRLRFCSDASYCLICHGISVRVISSNRTRIRLQCRNCNSWRNRCLVARKVIIFGHFETTPMCKDTDILSDLKCRICYGRAWF